MPQPDTDVDLLPTTTHGQAVSRLAAAVAGLPGVDSAAVTHAVPDPHVVVWSDAAAWGAVELLEQALLAGPCRQAMDTGMTVLAAPPLGADSAWPGWSTAAHRNGVRKMLVLPILTGNRCRSTVVLLSTTAAFPPVQTVDAAFRLAVEVLCERSG